MSLPITLESIPEIISKKVMNRGFSIHDEDHGGQPLAYLLDCLFQFGYIAPDVYFYFYHFHCDMNIFANITMDLDGGSGDYYKKMMYQGQHLEHQYINWRQQNQKLSSVVSIFALSNFDFCVKNNIDNMSGSIADKMVMGKLTTMNADDGLMKTTTVVHGVTLLRRCYNRIQYDLEAYSEGEIRDYHKIVEAFDEKSKDWQIANCREDRNWNKEPNLLPDQDKKPSKQKIKHARKVLKRSMKILSEIIGDNKTKMFIGNQAIRFEGKKANYEIKRVSRMAHNSLLSVYSKENPELHLCDVCIYTPNTPILDHVASIALHIRSGNEEELMSIGNAFNVSNIEPWMSPYIPAFYLNQTPEGVIHDPHADGFIVTKKNYVNITKKSSEIKNRVSKKLNAAIYDGNTTHLKNMFPYIRLQREVVTRLDMSFVRIPLIEQI